MLTVRVRRVGVVLTLNVALLAPAATVMLAGTWASAAHRKVAHPSIARPEKFGGFARSVAHRCRPDNCMV